MIYYYGGELARDWFDVYLIKRVGLDSGVQIREGKNLLGINYDVDDSDVVTRIMPTGEDKDGNCCTCRSCMWTAQSCRKSFMQSGITSPWTTAKRIQRRQRTIRKRPKSSVIHRCVPLRKGIRWGLRQAHRHPDSRFHQLRRDRGIQAVWIPQNIYLGDGVRVVTRRLGIVVTLR